ncbi:MULTISPECIES: antitoxin Xre/MbcA/ParS toxin-binding domain-containing protein [Aeromonas]|nr:antitoxin Xre/MbcA/ParS toxin-binding domain-containing protein [Aeromonas australiensis]
MAMAWLHCPAKGLGGEIPMNILTTPSGVQAVVDLIGRIEHGVIA